MTRNTIILAETKARVNGRLYNSMISPIYMDKVLALCHLAKLRFPGYNKAIRNEVIPKATGNAAEYGLAPK